MKLYIITGTKKAICVSLHDKGQGDTRGIWLPKSRISYVTLRPASVGKWQMIEAQVPDWLINKNLGLLQAEGAFPNNPDPHAGDDEQEEELRRTFATPRDSSFIPLFGTSFSAFFANAAIHSEWNNDSHWEP